MPIGPLFIIRFLTSLGVWDFLRQQHDLLPPKLRLFALRLCHSLQLLELTGVKTWHDSMIAKKVNKQSSVQRKQDMLNTSYIDINIH